MTTPSSGGTLCGVEGNLSCIMVGLATLNSKRFREATQGVSFTFFYFLLFSCIYFLCLLRYVVLFLLYGGSYLFE